MWSRSGAAWIIAVAVSVAPGPGTVSAPIVASQCAESPTENLLPQLVGPMTGAAPSWMVDGGVRWQGPSHPVKSLWVLHRTSQVIQIAGRLLGGSATASFRRGENHSPETLFVIDPNTDSVIPGGATADALRQYVFLPSHVFYPSAGCWQFTIRAGSTESTVTRLIAR